MAKFFERIGVFRRKETEERDVAPVEQVNAESDWVKAFPETQEPDWGSLEKVKFAGDKLAEVDGANDETPETQMGGGTYEEGVATEVEDSVEQASNPTLKALKDFFRMDMTLKNEMLRLAPKETDMYDEMAQIDYADKAYKGYKDMEWRFQKINEEFHLTSPETIEKFFSEGEKSFASGRYDARGLYQENISGLRPAFVEEVKKQCYGYGINDSGVVLKEARTVNELLHACHSAITNNEEILQQVPALATKREGQADETVLRGDDGALGRQIFEALPEDINAGSIDIVSVDERAIMMVRDRGHALLVQAEAFDPGTQKVLVSYNIPKIINRRMIEALPGIGTITEDGANGQFVCEENEVGEKVKEFIEMVPTDLDFEQSVA